MAPKDTRRTHKGLGLTQPDFARELGVSYATVNRWEQGRAKPQPDRIERLVDIVKALQDQRRSSHSAASGRAASRSATRRRFSNHIALNGLEILTLQERWGAVGSAVIGLEPRLEIRLNTSHSPSQDYPLLNSVLRKVKAGWTI